MLLHVTIAHPHWECTIIHFVDGHSDYFQVLAIKNNSAMNIFVYIFGVHVYAFLLDVFLGEEWLDYRAGACPAFVGNASFPKYLY